MPDTNDAVDREIKRRQVARMSDEIDSLERSNAPAQARIAMLRTMRQEVRESLAALEREGQRG